MKKTFFKFIYSANWDRFICRTYLIAILVMMCSVKNNNISHIYLALTLIFFSFFPYFLIYLLRKKFNKSEYTEGSRLGDWYDENIKSLGTDWCYELIDYIYKEINNISFTFISPSSNKGFYEEKMFLHISNKTKANFICSDITHFNEHAKTQVYKNSSYKYIAEQNALNLNEYFTDTADVIYDIKGALWYLSDQQQELEKLVSLYYNTLSNNGILVIDSGKTSTVIGMISSFVYFCLPKGIFRRVEESTERKLKKAKFFKEKFQLVNTVKVKCDNGYLSFNFYKKIV